MCLDVRVCALLHKGKFEWGNLKQQKMIRANRLHLKTSHGGRSHEKHFILILEKNTIENEVHNSFFNDTNYFAGVEAEQIELFFTCRFSLPNEFSAIFFILEFRPVKGMPQVHYKVLLSH